MADTTQGSRLLHLRSKKGFTQGELAKRAGVSRDTIHRLEADPTQGARLTTLYRIAQALEVELTDLIEEGAA